MSFQNQIETLSTGDYPIKVTDHPHGVRTWFFDDGSGVHAFVERREYDKEQPFYVLGGLFTKADLQALHTTIERALQDGNE